MLEIVIEQAAFCVLIGFVLSLIVAMAASQPVHIELQSILTRLVLAAVPAYLGVDYLVYQGLVMVIVAAGACGVGLYHFRGWWLPQRNPDAVERRLPTTRLRQAAVLRDRVKAVVRADRQHPYGAIEGQRAKAA